MASRGIYVSIALAFALVLLNVSFSTCMTVTFSTKNDSLTEDERKTVYGVLQDIAGIPGLFIKPDDKYYAGRLFSTYLNVSGKGVAIRFTRWSSECSVSMSLNDRTEGREQLEAFKQILPNIRPYLLDRGSEWAAVSEHTYWIDYYVRESYEKGKELSLQPADNPAYKIVSDDEGSSGTDCAIQPYMLLSHHSALPFNQLHPGDYLLTPDAKYKLTIPKLADGRVPSCVANLMNETGAIVWSTTSSSPQINCTLVFRSVGSLELWNNNQIIWNSKSACSSLTNCAGAASLAMKDGHIKLYQSLNDYLSIYDTIPPSK